MLEHYLGFVTINWFTVIATLIVVMIILNLSTSVLEEQLSLIWKKIKIPASVRGATFDAVSSSLPEFLTSLAGLLLLKEKWLEVGIWTIWGSAIFNILIIPALVLLFYKWRQIRIETKWVKRDSIFYILSILILLVGLYTYQLFWMWVALVVTYAAYIFYLYKQSLEHRKNNVQEIQDAYDEVKDEKINYLKILVSLILIYVWVEASIKAAEWIGNQLGISMLVVSLVLLAGITSIPDTLLSIKASKKWNIDAGLSNAVGSNIFDICIGLWVPLLIGVGLMKLHPEVNFSANVGVFVFLIISTIIYFVLLHKKNLTKQDWYWLLALYLLFIVYLAWIS